MFREPGDSTGRVLLITRNLPPVIGGMERLIGHVAEVLCTQYETIVVGPRGARLNRQAREYYDCPLSPPALFLATAALKARATARRYRPQLVFAGSGLTAPIARLAARKVGSRYVVYLHGLDIAARHPLYRRLFVPAIRRADLVLANSRYTAGLAIAAGVPEARISILHPGVELPQSIPDRESAARRFRERHHLPAAGPLLFAAGRLTLRKGLAAFVARAMPTILAQIPDAQLVIAGEVPRHATKRITDEAAAIRNAAAEIGDHVHLIGPLDDAGLSLAWPAADVHVFPVRNDPRDPEGFGMVALEAAAWGVPTVAFAAGGIADAVAESKSGYLVPPDNYVELASAAIKAIHQRTQLESSARAFAETFAWPRFNAQLLQLLHQTHPFSPEARR